MMGALAAARDMPGGSDFAHRIEEEIIAELIRADKK